MNNELPFKVRCIDASFNSRLTEGKEYEVKHITYEYCEEYYQVHNNDGVLEFCFSKRFEIVKTPKVGHKFSVGDKVYVGLIGKIVQVTEIIDDDVVSVANKNNEIRARIPNICHATQENYEMLCKLYPHIEFEQPPKPLTGSDLTKGMFERGDFAVPCNPRTSLPLTEDVLNETI